MMRVFKVEALQNFILNNFEIIYLYSWYNWHFKALTLKTQFSLASKLFVLVFNIETDKFPLQIKQSDPRSISSVPKLTIFEQIIVNVILKNQATLVNMANYSKTLNVCPNIWRSLWSKYLLNIVSNLVFVVIICIWLLC